MIENIGYLKGRSKKEEPLIGNTMVNLFAYMMQYLGNLTRITSGC